MKHKTFTNNRLPGFNALRCALALLLGLTAVPALAYVGPGLGAGTLGVILGLVGSLLLALVAFFWYPLKRAVLGKSADKDAEENLETVEQVAAASVDVPGDNDQK